MKSSVCFMRKHVPWPLILVCFSIKSHNSTVLQISRKKVIFCPQGISFPKKATVNICKSKKLNWNELNVDDRCFVSTYWISPDGLKRKKNYKFSIEMESNLRFSSEFSNGNKKLSHEYTNYFRERVNKKRQK